MFDYGQTLVDEGNMDAVKGTRAVLNFAISNKHNLSAEEVQNYADKINFELGRSDPDRRDGFMIEVPNHMFTSFLYKSLGIELSIDSDQIDDVFWNASNYCVPTDGIKELLEYLDSTGIRTAVVSNISFSGKALKNKINKSIPFNKFEFVIASSEYIFRKPSKHIFELALNMAELSAEDVWFVGDNYKCDVVGAESVGITAFLYGSHVNDISEPHCRKISHWKEFIQIIENAK